MPSIISVKCLEVVGVSVSVKDVDLKRMSESFIGLLLKRLILLMGVMKCAIR